MLRALALRAEDVVQRSVSGALLRAGRPVRVVPFSGTAGPDGARWEWYVKTGDSEKFSNLIVGSGGGSCCPA